MEILLIAIQYLIFPLSQKLSGLFSLCKRRNSQWQLQLSEPFERFGIKFRMNCFPDIFDFAFCQVKIKCSAGIFLLWYILKNDLLKTLAKFMLRKVEQVVLSIF